MKFDDQKQAEITRSQRRALKVLNLIMLVCTLVICVLVIIGAVTGANYNMVSIITILPFAVVYFNYRKFTGALDDCGICPRWAKIAAAAQPVIYVIVLVFSIFTI